MTIELDDLRGRRVASERHDDLGRGRHSLSLRIPATVDAGVYRLRLRHAGGPPHRTLVLVHQPEALLEREPKGSGGDHR